jgi:hypothetical protein
LLWRAWPIFKFWNMRSKHEGWMWKMRSIGYN